MLTRFAGALIGAACAGVLSAPPAAADAVECPSATMRGEIVSTLPSGWTQTVSNAALSGTSVAGGALICSYGAAGDISRAPPSGQTCTARTGGFDCTAGSTPGTPGTPRIAGVQIDPAAREPLIGRMGNRVDLSRLQQRTITGEVVLDIGEGVDFDTGVETRDGADFHLARGLTPILGAQLAPTVGVRVLSGGSSPAGQAGCASVRDRAPAAAGDLAFVSLMDGRHTCFQTAGGRIGEFVVVSRASTLDGPATRVTLRFTTWP